MRLHFQKEEEKTVDRAISEKCLWKPLPSFFFRDKTWFQLETFLYPSLAKKIILGDVNRVGRNVRQKSG